MADARRARAERRATLAAHVAQTAPVDGAPHCSPPLAAHATTGTATLHHRHTAKYGVSLGLVEPERRQPAARYG